MGNAWRSSYQKSVRMVACQISCQAFDWARGRPSGEYQYQGAGLNREQAWYFEDDSDHPNVGRLRPFLPDDEGWTNWKGDLCVDYSYRDDDVYLHKCHDGKNQKWHLTD